jgi:hypothetical protein
MEILCYTLIMDENQTLWINWSRVLHRLGISGEAASILEGSGSLSFLVAQMLYLSQPLLSGVVSEHSLRAFTRVLEDPSERRAFVSYLREAPLSGTGA